ncbi:MAG: tyrosine-type recombinase/integrase [Syntrophobacteraceae bacterium]
MDVKNPAREYLKHLQARNCSPHTVKNSKSVLKLFAGFLEEEGIVEIDQLTREVLEDYQQELAFTLTATGKPLAVRTQGKRLSVIKGFSRYLKEHDYLIHDPGAIIKLPRQAKQLPRAILDEPEIKKLIAAPDTRTNRGYRNRVIVELLYDTAIRRSEIADVKITDIDLDGGFLLVRGKGNKERVVPVSGRVSGLVRNYILAVRPAFINGDDPAYLILNRWGRRMDANGVWAVVKRCGKLAKLDKVTTHTLRHTCATHMLRNGAPIRHIQEMLGHESLETTMIYTHVTINDLKEIHAKYHPSERMQDKR